MICPACNEYIWVEDLHDTEPFQCEECGAWIELVLDEGTYKDINFKMCRYDRIGK